jgi:uncharacterized protein (TIGR03437 family)
MPQTPGSSQMAGGLVTPRSHKIPIAAFTMFLIGLAPAASGQSYTIYTIAGGGQQSNVLGTSPYVAGRGLSYLAVDRVGNLYFPSESQILRLDAATQVVTVVAGTNTAGFSGDNGSAQSAQLNYPQGLGLDPAGNLYIADSGNRRIRRIANGIITTVAGNGSPGSAGDGGLAINAQFDILTGLAVDAAGNIYVADANSNRVRKIANGIITAFAGTGMQGYSGDHGPATSAQLAVPMGVAAGPDGTVYIADNSRVVRAVSQGVISTVAGIPAPGPLGDNGPATAATIVFPTDLTVDATGNIYIADRSGNRVRKVSKGVISTVAGNGTAGSAGDGGPAVNSQLSGPGGVAVDSAGNLYISDGQNFRIRRVANGTISTVVGNGQLGFIGNNVVALAAAFSYPSRIARDASGSLCFTANGRVFKISNGVLSTIAGTGMVGFSGDGGPATAAQLNSPGGVAVDSAGSVYIAEYLGNRVRRVTNGIITTVAGTGEAGLSGDGGPATAARLNNPSGVAVDTAGNLYISDYVNHRIRKVSGGVITTFAGTDQGFSGDNGPAAKAQLAGPSGITVDLAGNLYIADSANGRIRKISNGVITTVAGTGGIPTSDGDGGPSTNAHFNDPIGVAVDSAGNLYVAEYVGHRIRRISNGIVTTIAGTGKPDLSGDFGPAAKAALNSPSDLTVDATGSIYVTDLGNQRIRVMVPDGTACSYLVTPTSLTAPPSGGDVEVTVRAPSYCPWRVDSLPDWMLFSSAASNSQTATVKLTVTPNAVATRTATVTIGTASVEVRQAGKGTPSINAGGVLNSASSAVGGALAPGSIATAYGTFLVSGVASASGAPLPQTLGGLAMQFVGGVAVPLYSVTAGQVSFQVPWELAGQAQTALGATVNGQSGDTVPVRLSPYAPGIFTMNSQGSGQGAILDAGYDLVDASNPAIAGTSVIQIFCTGLGAVTSQPPSGAAAGSDPLSHTTSTPTVTVGGMPATVLFSGLTPGAVGLYQVNVVVPAGSAKGVAVPVVIGMEGSTSNAVTIAVQ